MDLSVEDYDVTNVGEHLSAKQWNEAINKGAIVGGYEKSL